MSRKKWITQADAKKIINTYSIRIDEFKQVSNINYCYTSTLVKGYMITLSEEENNVEKTGRIIVTHTRDNGKRTYVDIWGRAKDDRNLCFLFRNLWNQPTSDLEYIKDLERQIEELKQAGKELKAQLNTLTPAPCPHGEQPKRNERNAGRKPSRERLSAIAQMQTLIQSGASEQDIMSKLGISRSTFYRYKRSINN